MTIVDSPREMIKICTVMVIEYSKDVEKPLLMRWLETNFMNRIEFQSFLYVNIPSYELSMRNESSRTTASPLHMNI